MDISDAKAVELLKKRDSSEGGSRRGNNREDMWDENKRDDADVMTFGGNDDGGYDGDNNDGDPFNRAINITLEHQDGAQVYEPVTVDGRCLLKMKREEVFYCKPIIEGMRMRFFKNMIPEIAVAISQPCHRFFNEEDFEFVYLRDGVCPVSRLKDVGDYGSL